jgi:hypothetical protein
VPPLPKSLPLVPTDTLESKRLLVLGKWFEGRKTAATAAQHAKDVGGWELTSAGASAPSEGH